MAAKVQALRSKTARITFFSSSPHVVSVSSNAEMVRRWASGAAVVAGKRFILLYHRSYVTTFCLSVVILRSNTVVHSRKSY